jgi:hypothetical protein
MNKILDPHSNVTSCNNSKNEKIGTDYLLYVSWRQLGLAEKNKNNRFYMEDMLGLTRKTIPHKFQFSVLAV